VTDKITQHISISLFCHF